MYWVQWKTRKANPARKSRAERYPATGLNWNPVRSEKYDQFKIKYNKLKIKYNKLKIIYNKLKIIYNKLKIKYNKLKIIYNKLKVKYNNYVNLLLRNCEMSSNWGILSLR